VPKFRSDEEAAECFESHSVAGVWEELGAGEPVRLNKRLAKSIRERHEREKSRMRISEEFRRGAKGP
jgi:hypothetical protein